jgi:hypothetical protein
VFLHLNESTEHSKSDAQRRFKWKGRGGTRSRGTKRAEEMSAEERKTVHNNSPADKPGKVKSLKKAHQSICSVRFCFGSAGGLEVREERKQMGVRQMKTRQVSERR